MSTYGLIGRLIGPAAIAMLVVQGRIFKRPRARVVAFDEAGRVLLVRSWIKQHVWDLPGGGANRGELPQTAARREFFEETGIDMPLDAFAYLATITGHGYEAPIYVVKIPAVKAGQARRDPREIMQFEWCCPDAITEASPMVHEALAKISSNETGLV